MLAVKTFEWNQNDSKTIKPLLEQHQQTEQKLPKEVIYDRGGRDRKNVKGVKVTTPTKPEKTSKNKKRRMRRRFRRRAGIEGIISHLKSDHRMAENYLHGKDSPQINAMLAAAGWNMTKWMQRVIRVGEAFCWLLEKWTKLLFFKSLKVASSGATK